MGAEGIEGLGAVRHVGREAQFRVLGQEGLHVAPAAVVHGDGHHHVGDSPPAFCSSATSGRDFRQGGHQVAHTSTSTTLPLNSARVCRWPWASSEAHHARRPCPPWRPRPPADAQAAHQGEAAQAGGPPTTRTPAAIIRQRDSGDVGFGHGVPPGRAGARAGSAWLQGTRVRPHNLSMPLILDADALVAPSPPVPPLVGPPPGCPPGSCRVRRAATCPGPSTRI